MNDVLKTIHERKSVRNYSDTTVKPQDLKEILESAVLAPNAMNKQAWHFTAVTDPALIGKMSEACRKGMAECPAPPLRQRAADPSFHAFFHAPAVIVVSVAPDKFTPFDAGAAAQNICLSALSLGYGTCVTASTGFMIDGDPSLKQELDFPEGYEFICAITLGIEEEGPDDHIRDRNMDVISYK